MERIHANKTSQCQMCSIISRAKMGSFLQTTNFLDIVKRAISDTLLHCSFWNCTSEHPENFKSEAAARTTCI